ncbi:MAG: MmcQ/YjbR family DNA-binding protein [Hyphomicrobiales bacterium]
MTLAQYNAFCAALPATSTVVQWGGASVWKVGGKVFAIGWFDNSVDHGITFKCSPMSFEMLQEVEGCRPAPYLASRGMKWIQRTRAGGLSNADLKAYLRESHRLVTAGLSRKKRRELGLEGPDAA